MNQKETILLKLYERYTIPIANEIADIILEERNKIVKEVIRITQDQKDLYSGYSMTRKGTCGELMEQFNKLLE